ncbi:MAG: ATP-binding protein [Candidatus Dormibacteraeota bacterium]|nr:ATP-binding protein [Candidatus Dormibacteraeota bacterium]
MKPAANESEDLMSVLGHELRSPLTVIRGAATLLLQAHEEMAPEKVSELLAGIDAAAARMADRVEDVLVAGRLHASRQPAVVEDVDLRDVVGDVLEAARSRNAGRRLSARGAARGIAVRADQQRVTQVLRVLVENAIRFSPPGSPVEVWAARAGRLARVEVRDRGPGIAAADRRRILGRGVKIDPSGPGAGLGLYVAAGLLAIMEGELGLEPREGGGTTFWFTLPAVAK